MLKVAIIMGSTSDYDVMSGAEQILSDFGIEFEKRVISAHRTPELMFEYTKGLKGRGFGVVIAGAGGAAHLAGVAAGLTTLPVIAVPMQTKALGGLDSLLSMVQMPTGIPVATSRSEEPRTQQSLRQRSSPSKTLRSLKSWMPTARLKLKNLQYDYLERRLRRFSTETSSQHKFDIEQGGLFFLCNLVVNHLLQQFE